MALDPEARQFVKMLGDMKRRLDRLEKGAQTAQLGYSSLEDAGIPAFDATGTLRQIVGKQSDGTFAVTYANGDAPPTPSAPLVSARQLAIVVGWDGTFAGAVARPGDFARVDVHMGPDPSYQATGATLYGSLVGEGAVVIPADVTTHYIKLVAVTLADVPSAPTDAVAVTPLPASELAAGSVTAEQLAAEIALASTLVAGDPAGARVELSRDGLTAYDVAGQPTVTIPTDPNADSVFKGNVEADGLTVNGTVALRGEGNEVSKGANLLLQAATTAPQNAPTAQVGLLLDNAFINGKPSMKGLAYHNGELWSMEIDDTLASLVLTSYSGSTVNLGIPTDFGGYGFCRVGSYWYTLTFSGSTYYLHKIDNTGTTVDFTTYAKGSVQFGGKSPLLAASHSTSTLRIWWYEPSPVNAFRYTEVNTSDLTLGGSYATNSVGGFGGEVVAAITDTTDPDFDFGTGISETVILTDTGSNYWPFDATRTYQPEHAWPPAGEQIGATQIGAAWDGTRFWALMSDGRLAKHSTLRWTGTSTDGYVTRKFEAAYTWRNAAGGYETPVGPVASFTMKKRAWVGLTSTEIPGTGNADDPDSVAFYLNDTITTDQALRLQTLPAVGANSVTIGDDFTETGATAPTANNFPGGTPGSIRNADDTLVISGDGTIKADLDPSFGTWQNLTLRNSWGNLNASYPLRGRAAPGGDVQVTGAVTGGANSNGTVFANLPAALRPPVETFISAGTNTGYSVNVSVRPNGDMVISNLHTAPTTIYIDDSFHRG